MYMYMLIFLSIAASLSNLFKINHWFCTFYFQYPTLKAADKSWNIDPSQYPHIWQCQNFEKIEIISVSFTAFNPTLVLSTIMDTRIRCKIVNNKNSEI